MKKIVMPLIAFVCGLVIMPKVYATDVANKGDLKTEVEKGGDIKLTANIDDLDQVIEITHDVTIDLGGKTITSNANRVFNVKNGTVVIKNGKIINENGNSDGAIIYVYGSDSKEGSNKVNLTLDKSLTLEGIGGIVVSTDNSGKTFGVVVNVDGKINVTKKQNGIETSAITVHGKLKEGDAVINVSGELTGIDAGIYQAGASTINLKSGAKVTGASGVVTKAGALNVTGATVSGTGQLASSEASGNGFVPTGAGIQIESNKNYAGNVDVNIDGGKVSSTNNSAIEEYLAGETTKSSVNDIAVKGNATLVSADDKEIITASDKFNEVQKAFIEKGTTLEGKVENIDAYLGEGLEIEGDKVVDPNEPTITDPTTNPDTPTNPETPAKPETNKADKNPATGDNILTLVLLLGLALTGTVVTAKILKKS